MLVHEPKYGANGLILSGLFGLFFGAIWPSPNNFFQSSQYLPSELSEHLLSKLFGLIRIPSLNLSKYPPLRLFGLIQIPLFKTTWPHQWLLVLEYKNGIISPCYSLQTHHHDLLNFSLLLSPAHFKSFSYSFPNITKKKSQFRSQFGHALLYFPRNTSLALL